MQSPQTEEIMQMPQTEVPQTEEIMQMPQTEDIQSPQTEEVEAPQTENVAMEVDEEQAAPTTEQMEVEKIAPQSEEVTPRSVKRATDNGEVFFEEGTHDRKKKQKRAPKSKDCKPEKEEVSEEVW